MNIFILKRKKQTKTLKTSLPSLTPELVNKYLLGTRPRNLSLPRAPLEVVLVKTQFKDSLELATKPKCKKVYPKISNNVQ